MLKGKLGNKTVTPQEWDNPLPRWMRSLFWRKERRAQDASIATEAHDTWRRRGIDWRATFDANGDTLAAAPK